MGGVLGFWLAEALVVRRRWKGLRSSHGGNTGSNPVGDAKEIKH